MRKYNFDARIEAVSNGGAYVLFPYDVRAEFGTRGQERRRPFLVASPPDLEPFAARH
jgi:hypothetical protein